MPLTLDDRLLVPEFVSVRKLGDESVLLNLQSGTYFGLDAVGTRFLELLREHGRLAAVHEAMLREYDVSPERLAGDLLQLSEQCLAQGLLSRA